MLSRSLFVYVVVGLVVSATAKPMGQTGDSNKKSWRYDVGKRGSYDQQPEQKKPENPSYSKPENPSYSKPENMSYSKPEKPSYPKPNDKGKSDSYDPKGNTGQCSVGQQQCCNQVISSQDKEVPSFLGFLDIADLEDILELLADVEPDSFVARDCSPRRGDSGCTASPMCCTGNHFNGLASIGCSPDTDIDVDVD